MNTKTKQQKGSPIRDNWKWWHKGLSPDFWATDVDFEFIEKVPFPHVAAVLDFKGERDSLHFTQGASIRDKIRDMKPFYVVVGNEAFEKDLSEKVFLDIARVRVYRILYASHVRPSFVVQACGDVMTFKQFGQWEGKTREESRQNIESNTTLRLFSIPKSLKGGGIKHLESYLSVQEILKVLHDCLEPDDLKTIAVWVTKNIDQLPDVIQEIKKRILHSDG